MDSAPTAAILPHKFSSAEKRGHGANHRVKPYDKKHVQSSQSIKRM